MLLNANIGLRLMRSPDVILQALRTGFRKRVLAPMAARAADGAARPFARLDIKIINACNLRCEMCGQWGDAGWHKNMPGGFEAAKVPLETYRRLVDDVSAHRPWISIWGGEPFLYPDLIPLLRHIKRRSMTVTVNTNGLTLASHAEALAEMGIDVLLVSIDGARQTHDKVRGLEGAFDRTMKGIAAVRAARRARGGAKPFIVIAGTFNRHNAARFDEVFESAEEAGADGLTACFGWFQTGESSQRHAEAMLARLGTFVYSAPGWQWRTNEIDSREVSDSVRRIQARRWSFPHVFLPRLASDEIARYYDDHSFTFGNDKCSVPWTTAYLLPNGDVTTCGDYPDYIAGNITRSPILEIWNADRYRRFRKELCGGGLLPACSRCCGLLAE